MAARVTVEDVKEILETQMEPAHISPFITLATLMVTESVAPFGICSAARLTQIELYLAAHFTTLRDPKVASESTDEGRSTLRYEGKFGKNLDSSRYGQTAMFLDETGELAKLAKGKQRAVIAKVGTSPDGTDYDN